MQNFFAGQRKHLCFTATQKEAGFMCFRCNSLLNRMVLSRKAKSIFKYSVFSSDMKSARSILVRTFPPSKSFGHKDRPAHGAPALNARSASKRQPAAICLLYRAFGSPVHPTEKKPKEQSHANPTILKKEGTGQ